MLPLFKQVFNHEKTCTGIKHEPALLDDNRQDFEIHDGIVDSTRLVNSRLLAFVSFSSLTDSSNFSSSDFLDSPISELGLLVVSQKTRSVAAC
jgi:hypothetical protein